MNLLNETNVINVIKENKNNFVPEIYHETTKKWKEETKQFLNYFQYSFLRHGRSKNLNKIQISFLVRPFQGFADDIRPETGKMGSVGRYQILVNVLGNIIERKDNTTLNLGYKSSDGLKNPVKVYMGNEILKYFDGNSKWRADSLKLEENIQNIAEQYRNNFYSSQLYFINNVLKTCNRAIAKKQIEKLANKLNLNN